MCLGGEVKKRVRFYRHLTSGALVGNLVLVGVAICVAFVLGLTQVSLSVVLLNLVVAMVAAGVLAYVGSGWAMAGIALVFPRASRHTVRARRCATVHPGLVHRHRCGLDTGSTGASYPRPRAART